MGSCTSKDPGSKEPTTKHHRKPTQVKRQEQTQALQNQQENIQQQQQSRPQRGNITSSKQQQQQQQQSSGSSTENEQSNSSTLYKNHIATNDKQTSPSNLQQQQHHCHYQNESSNGTVATVGTTSTFVSQNPVDAAAKSNPHHEVKVLLLGSGESGKSTIVKQMKILHQNGYTQEELYEYRPFVFKNVIDCIKNVINAIIDLEPDLIKPKSTITSLNELNNGTELQESTTTGTPPPATAESTIPTTPTATVPAAAATTTTTTTTTAAAAAAANATTTAKNKHVLDYDSLNEILDYEILLDGSNDATFDPSIAEKIEEVYNKPEVKDFMIHKQGDFYLIDSTDYFLSNVSRITQPEYIPSTTDILRTRKKTSGIFDFEFDMGRGLNIHMYDVGGQRSERKKWIHCFDNVTLIIFCVALSEYDQVLLEENNQNRLEESLALFDSVVNSRWFARTSIVLFLNKIDVFAEKLQYSPLESHFPDYTGGNNINKAAKYILWRFNQVNRSGLNIYPHVTQATDTSNIQLVMAAVQETILENSLKDTGLI